MSAPLVITLGCRLNAHESEVMRQSALAAGLDGCVIVNTCAVTAEAVRQAQQSIRRARRDRPAAKIIVTGCAAQTAHERFASMDEVDHIAGNAEKMRPETFRAIAAGHAPRIAVGDIMSERRMSTHAVDGFEARARATVQIQNGCDHRCTFCIIPFGRGPSRSVPPEEVVRQVHKLFGAGYLEVVLTGVDITAYGRDLDSELRLGTLVQRILKEVPGLQRLRLSSIDSIEADADLVRAIAGEPRLMPHLHLSIQSGNDMVLKRMKRRHSRADTLRFCEDMRRLRPDIVFGADVIAGFPTETEEMFRSTLELIEDCGLTYLHVFPFSAREGTPAARMPPVPGAQIKERAQRLRQKGERLLQDYLSSQTGRDVDILLERWGGGRTPQFAETRVVTRAPAGSMTRVRIKGHDGRRLEGEVIA